MVLDLEELISPPESLTTLVTSAFSRLPQANKALQNSSFSFIPHVSHHHQEQQAPET